MMRRIPKTQPVRTRGAYQLVLLALLSFTFASATPIHAQPTSKSPEPEGKLIYNQRCASCHFSDSTSQKIGPGLKGLFTRSTFANGKKVDEAAVIRWIEVGGKNMPGFKDALKAEQLHALISYLKTL